MVLPEVKPREPVIEVLQDDGLVRLVRLQGIEDIAREKDRRYVTSVPERREERRGRI